MMIGATNLENSLYGEFDMKTAELKALINQLFEKAESKEAIQQAAVISTKIDEIEAEQKAAKDDYDSLLKDYKEVILHTSFKPLNTSDRGADEPTANIDPNKAFDDALKAAMAQKQN